MLIVSMPSSFAHPDPLNANVITNGTQVEKLKIIGLGEEKDKELEWFTVPWFWHNFMLFLSSGLTGIIGFVFFTTYRKEFNDVIVKEKRYFERKLVYFQALNQLEEALKIKKKLRVH